MLGRRQSLMLKTAHDAEEFVSARGFVEIGG
jgi:hypothetical protein